MAWAKVTAEAGTSRQRRKDSKARREFDQIVEGFANSLHFVTILDPACGSGNFLYVAINLLLDIEKEILTYAAEHDLSLIPVVRPNTTVLGLEINKYAQQLRPGRHLDRLLAVAILQWLPGGE